MRKYGFLKHSLVDYPGEVCSVVFLPGCNFCCPYCHNKNLSAEVGRNGWSLTEIIHYLEEARTFITAVCITGGEPTLMPETLCYLIEVFKALGLKVKLDSNGSSPDLLQKVSKKVDYIAMDLKTSIDRYPELVKSSLKDTIVDSIKTSMVLLMERPEKAYEFRTTLSWNFVNDEVIHDLGRRLKLTSYWYLQRCRLDGVPNKVFLEQETKKIKDCYNIAKKYTEFVFLRE